MAFPLTRSRQWFAAAMLGIALPACSSTTEPLSGLPVTLTQRFIPAPPQGAPSADPPVAAPITAFKDTVIASTVQQPTCSQTRASAGIQGNRLVISLTIEGSPVQVCMLMSGVVVYTLTVHGIPPGRYLADFQLLSGTSQKPTPISSAVVTLL